MESNWYMTLALRFKNFLHRLRPRQSHIPQWTKQGVVWAGQYVAADPYVVETAAGVRTMYYTDYDGWTVPDTLRNYINKATETGDDGAWADAGAAKVPEIDEWCEADETACMFESVLYFCGNDDDADEFNMPSHIGRGAGAGATKIIEVTEGTRYASAATSPAIIRDGDTLYMLFCGHDYVEPINVPCLMGATSIDDGVNWTVQDVVLDAQPNLLWASEGVAEPAIVKRGGRFWLFFTGVRAVGASEYRAIGQAHAPHPLGPYTVLPDAIITETNSATHQSLAPHVIYKNGKWRMWYTYAVPGDGTYAVHYATANTG